MKRKTLERRMGVRMGPKLHAAIRKAASREGRTDGHIIREALCKQLGVEE